MNRPTLKYQPKSTTPVQRDRAAESQSIGETEKQSFGVIQETDDTHDSALSPSVVTVQGAVALSLAEKLDENCLFRFSRALRAFEQNTGIKIQCKELAGIFGQWWQSARQMLSEDASKEEYEFLFLEALPKAKIPLGANALEQAIELANELQQPEICAGHDPRIAHLIAVCWHLSKITGGVFFISVRDAARVLKTQNKFFAAAMLNGLVLSKVLAVVQKGKSGRKATRYQFHQ